MKTGTWEEAVLWLRSQPEYAALVRAAYFDAPILEAARRFHRSAEWAATTALIGRPGLDVVDLGAGMGIASFALATDGHRVVAVEPDPSSVVGRGSIRELAGHVAGLTVAEGTGEKLPLPDASVDVVYARQVLHHARDLRALCAEVSRVLRPGGRLIATREHVVRRDADVPAFQRRHPLHRLYGGEFAYTEREYTQAIVGAGLTIERILGPFESTINSHPRDVDAVVRRVRGAPLLGRLLASATALALQVGSRIPWPPGRLFTFVARR